MVKYFMHIQQSPSISCFVKLFHHRTIIFDECVNNKKKKKSKICCIYSKTKLISLLMKFTLLSQFLFYWRTALL